MGKLTAGSMIVAGVWTGSRFSHLKNSRTRIYTFMST